MRRFSIGLMLFALLALALPALTSAPVRAQPRERCFEETGFCVSDPILSYWEGNGGLSVFGYPITELRQETVEATWTGPVQWFERDRLEDHSADGQGVLAGRLGATILELQGRPWTTFPQVESAPAGCRYFPETKHSLCPPFAAYWEQNGGLERFGYPITEAQQETIGDWTGNIQYFERRRMEHHTENRGTQFEVLLGLLGKEVLTYGAGGEVDTAGRIAFTSTRSGNQDIWVMNADGSNARNVTNNASRNEFQPAWSSDGSKIAYVAGTEVTQDQDIWVIDADGTDARQLTDNETADWGPTWSPDGTKIAFVSDRDGNADIWVRNADGSGEDTLLTSFGPDTAEYSPAWSPDGSRIAYVSDEGGNPAIWVMRSDGTERYELTTDNSRRHNNPAWSPDNARIVYQYDYGSGSPYLAMTNTDASETSFVNGAYGSNPSWSPGGGSVAYEAQGDIYVINLDGSGNRNLTSSDEVVDRDAAWR